MGLILSLVIGIPLVVLAFFGFFMFIRWKWQGGEKLSNSVDMQNQHSNSMVKPNLEGIKNKALPHSKSCEILSTEDKLRHKRPFSTFDERSVSTTVGKDSGKGLSSTSILSGSQEINHVALDHDVDIADTILANKDLNKRIVKSRGSSTSPESSDSGDIKKLKLISRYGLFVPFVNKKKSLVNMVDELKKRSIKINLSKGRDLRQSSLSRAKRTIDDTDDTRKYLIDVNRYAKFGVSIKNMESGAEYDSDSFESEKDMDHVKQQNSINNSISDGYAESDHTDGSSQKLGRENKLIAQTERKNQEILDELKGKFEVSSSSVSDNDIESDHPQKLDREIKLIMETKRGNQEILDELNRKLEAISTPVSDKHTEANHVNESSQELDHEAELIVQTKRRNQEILDGLNKKLRASASKLKVEVGTSSDLSSNKIVMKPILELDGSDLEQKNDKIVQHKIKKLDDQSDFVHNQQKEAAVFDDENGVQQAESENKIDTRQESIRQEIDKLKTENARFYDELNERLAEQRKSLNDAISKMKSENARKNDELNEELAARQKSLKDDIGEMNAENARKHHDIKEKLDAFKKSFREQMEKDNQEIRQMFMSCYNKSDTQPQHPEEDIDEGEYHEPSEGSIGEKPVPKSEYKLDPRVDYVE